MMRILKVLSKFADRWNDIKSSKKGYVLVLTCFLIPVLLLGSRWVLEYANKGKTLKRTNIEKRCAREAALAVAESVNPGIKFSEQKETLIRVADDIYNKFPAYGFEGVPDAIPGLLNPIYEKKKEGKNYDPMVIGVKEYQSFAPDVKQVPYKKANKYIYRVAFSCNANVGEVFRRIYFLKKDSRVTDECAIVDFLPYIDNSEGNVNLYSYGSFHQGADTSSHVSMKYLASSSSAQLQDPDYIERQDPDDPTVQIAIDNDRIWAKTDNDTAYAVPAECNVDIVITVPTNQAACNLNNRDDVPTVLSGVDTRSTVSSDTLASNANVRNFRSTPIYQIAQAYHIFLQQFLHTRGTNVGIVPYSGKLSLPPDRATGWTQAFQRFSWPDASQNTYIHNLKGSFLYGTVGKADTALNTAYSVWGGGYNLPEKHGGFGIMFRGNTLQESSYANNYVCHGDLLSNDNPASYKFYRFNYNPCYITNINLMNMKSIADSPIYCHNPYFVVELQADVAKIDDLMDAFVPFNDQNNKSNFIFLPITWAHNLFQSWSKDPLQTSKSSPEELYRPSKTTSGRKKAVILIVNKPDWFEPNEMTYLGFDNDLSEMPFVESDVIRFDIQQTTSLKYADGTAKATVTNPTANSRLYGQKKYLSFYMTSGSLNFKDGYYGNSALNTLATGVLRFPKKYLVWIKVKAMDDYVATMEITGSGTYTLNGAESYDTYREFFIEPSQMREGTDGDYYITLKMKNIQLIAAEITNRPYKKEAPYVRLSGSTEGVSGTAYISTNIRRPIQITATPYSYVQIHNDNGISENVGTYDLLTNPQTLTFSGSNNFSSLTDGSKNITHMSTSGGRNFGHNLSTQKLKYTLTNAKLTSATLRNQLLRWYAHYGYTMDNVNSKGIILNNNGHVGTVHDNNVEKYSDPCINAHYGDNYNKDAGYVFNAGLMGSNTKKTEYANASSVSVKYTANGADSGGCGKHFVKTCTGCGNYNCTVTVNCPSGYSPVVTSPKIYGIGSGLSDKGKLKEEVTSGSFKYVVKPNRNKMASITCTNGCYLESKSTTLTNGCSRLVSALGYNFISGQVQAHNFHPACYGIRKGKFIFTATNFPAYISGDLGLTLKSNSKNWESLGRNINKYTSNIYQVVNFDGGNTDWVSIFTGRIRYKSSEKYSYYTGSYTYATRTKTSHEFTGGDCNSHFLGTCDGCAGYTCTIWGSCPWGYEFTPENQDGFSINWNYSEHKMACISCVNGCNPTYNNANKGCRKKVYSNCDKYYNTSGGITSDGCSGKAEVSLVETIYTNHRYDLNNFFFLNTEDKTFAGVVSNVNDGNLLRNNGIYSYGDHTTDGTKWLCFCGDGNLTVTFAMKNPPTVTYYDTFDKAVKEDYTEQTVLNIDPTTHAYVRQADGTYKIRIDFTYTKLIGLGFVSNPGSSVCIPTKITTPNNCGYIRWDAGSTVEIKNISSGTFSNMEYINNRLAYCLKHNGSYNYLYYNYVGEFFMLNDDEDYILKPGTSYWRILGTSSTYYDYLGNSIYRTCLNRKYIKSGYYWWDNCSFYYPIVGIMCGVTLPINAALYYGANGKTDHAYSWQSATNGTWNTNYGDATAALQRLTSSAMQKLKSAYGNNSRIYVILYRPQSGNYSYLNTYAHNVLQADSEKDLQEIMEAVAIDVKSWAEYKEARIVEKYELEEEESKNTTN